MRLFLVTRLRLVTEAEPLHSHSQGTGTAWERGQSECRVSPKWQSFLRLKAAVLLIITDSGRLQFQHAPDISHKDTKTQRKGSEGMLNILAQSYLQILTCSDIEASVKIAIFPISHNLLKSMMLVCR